MLADDCGVEESTNIDAWALYRNWETSLALDDPQISNAYANRLLDLGVSRSTWQRPGGSGSCA
jgi:hypothetical protein